MENSEATNVSPTSGDYTNFILANGSHGINFYTISAAGNLAAGKAYLSLPTSAVNQISNSARGLKLLFMDDVTGIENAENGKLKVENYADGKYFENGQIVIMKNGKKYNAAGALLN